MMKLGILLLMTISGIILVSSLPMANSELQSNGQYLLQGNGFTVTEKSIENSELDLQFSTGSLLGGRMKVTMEDGVVSFSDDDYLVDRWIGTVLLEGRFLRLSGDASNVDGEKISLQLFGRLVENSEEGSVYGFTGRLTKDGESMKVIYTTTVVGSGNFLEEIIPTQEKPAEQKIIQISILPGSSKAGNINYYSMPTVEITPGTTVVWTNDDSVPHRITSGVASFSHGKPFKPDGKIDSGDITPGQTFSVTINELGITRFFDINYSWMDGVIISLPDAESKSIKKIETQLEKANKYK